MGKTYFEDIGEGRSKGGEKVNPHRVLIAGLDPETIELAKDSKHAQTIAEATMPTNAEIAAFLKDTDKFFKSWPIEATRVYMRNLLEGVLTEGGNLKPVMVVRVGDVFVVLDGRHNVAVSRVARECLSGKRSVAAIEGLIARLRSERGDDWKPILTATPPPTSADTGQEMSAALVADRSQVVRTMTLPEQYERAMMRVRAARAGNNKPNFSSIARDFGQTERTVENWERLSRFPPRARELVLHGDGTRTVPLTSAMELQGLPDDMIVSRLEAMFAGGDTRVETAKATARAAKEDLATATLSRQGEFTATAPVAEVGQEPRATGRREKTDEASGEAPAKDREASAPVHRAPWKKRDLGKFIDEHVGIDRKKTDEWKAFAAAAKLFTEGPDSLTKADFKALGDLGTVLDKVIHPPPPKKK
jgi:hypothetical protein